MNDYRKLETKQRIAVDCASKLQKASSNGHPTTKEDAEECENLQLTLQETAALVEGRISAVAYRWPMAMRLVNPLRWVNGAFLLSLVLVGTATLSLLGRDSRGFGVMGLLSVLLLSLVSIIVGKQNAPLALVGSVAFGVGLVVRLSDHPRGLVLALPLVAITGTYEGFRRMTLEAAEVSIVENLRLVGGWLSKIPLWIIQVLSGKAVEMDLVIGMHSRRHRD